MERLSFDLDGGDDGSGEAKAGNPGTHSTFLCPNHEMPRNRVHRLKLKLLGWLFALQHKACSRYFFQAPLLVF